MFFIALPGGVWAGEAKILSMSGNVEARQTREGQWAPASENLEIAEGGALRTGADGAAVLLLPNKTKVWLKETSNLEIEQRQTLASRLALVFGRIKVRVPHLMRKEKFEVRTPAAVCAVRGTEFTMATTEEGKMNLQVLFGEVKLKFVIPPEKGSDEFYIPQGQGLSLDEKGKAAKPALLTPKAEREALENWNPGVKPEDRQNDLKQKENDRAQVKEFARVTTNSENAVKSFLNVVKESDLEAGRTLTDVHGNLVRVDQRMMRPQANQIQFFNLVKRPTYANYTADTKGFVYNGGAVTNRLDYMQMTMAFNQDLPQRIEEWPGFFNGNSVDADWASFVLANRTDAHQIFFIAEGYKKQAKAGGGTELVNDMRVINAAGNTNQNMIMTGVLTDDSSMPGTFTAVDGLNAITNLKVAADAGNAGKLVYLDGLGAPAANQVGGTNANANVVWAVKTGVNAQTNYSNPKDRPDNAPLVQYQADMYDVGNAHGSYMWFTTENYVISNSGGIRTPNDFTNSSSDPFTLLKDNALESVMSIKQSLNNTPSSITTNNLAYSAINNSATGDYFTYGSLGAGKGTNIDIVFIPDLMVAAVQRMLPAITNLKD